MAANSLTYQFKTANIVIKLIAINTVIFLFATLGSWIFKTNPESLMKWFVLPTEINALVLQIWGLLTYSFLHFDFWHIFWNMLMLYLFGRFVLNLFNEKRFLTIYLLGAICGGVLFVLAYNLFPVLSGKVGYLIGASASVLAIVIFIASYTPNTEVRLIFFNVKLWHIGVFAVLSDLIQLPSSGNAGGLIAHMGGAIFGYAYAIQLKKGNDIGAWFEKMIDGLVTIFKPSKKSPLKTVHKSKTRKTSAKKTPTPKNPNQAQIDAILDKISKSGYDSLTKEEKDFLFKAGKE
ncbi:rhomboid family intramembrane serine protease [Aquimarina sp. 2201CG5-10]|uniref:rhomboid family intramembrane serine protease n=1 Tax=Aquimarina callyspongiae TaxID=3098150 RepID=UPI002AB56B1C|nr:rhomboid family intramembrane serine protease [Aquimarina sp. 2201CG5-10]MDY8137652.1 rhomboid family intramembrane serine protease [Aquimarina sp. 2201CG5-10]